MRLFGLHPRSFARFYRWRVRRHPLQELFAAAGIAVGVALVFAVQVANTSVTGSATQIVRELAGTAQVQLVARSAGGFDERVVSRVKRLPSVRVAAPLLRTRAALEGPSGRRPIELVGVTPAIQRLGGELTRNYGTSGLQLGEGIALPRSVAEAIGAAPDQDVTLVVAGRSRKVAVGAILGADAIGALAGSQSAIAPLPLAQQLAGTPGRVHQLLVVPTPGHDAAVSRDLARVAGGRLTVAPADADLRALRVAARPNEQATMLFAGICAMVGFLFALNAMLLTSGERRRFIADLRVQGFDTRQVVAILMFEALVLGTVASVAGLLLGDALSRLVFDDLPAYLSFAFPVGTQRVVYTSTIVLAAACGVLATLVASLRPLLDLRRRRALDAVFRVPGEPGEGISRPATNAMLVAGIALVGATTLLVLLLPGATIAGGVTLGVAAVLVMPAVFSWSTAGVYRLSRAARGRANMAMLAMGELRAARTRWVALAAVTALAVYGSVAIGGAHSDVVRGLDQHTAERLSTTDLWVTTGGDDLGTDSFDAERVEPAIAALPQVRDVRRYHSSFLDLGDRRAWVVARPREDPTIIPRSQMVEGDHARATRALRQGGAVAVSSDLAAERHVDLGDRITLPAPTGDVSLRVAAITTNLGWGPGALILNSADYRRAWGSDDPAALEVDLAEGVSPEVGKRAVTSALPMGTGLTVQTTAERQAQFRRLARQGLTRLNQISILLLIAAALAVSAGMAAGIWQRRRQLAALRVQGFSRGQLWRMLIHQAAFVVGIGSLVGGVSGVYGHLLASRWLEATTGYPAPFALAQGQILLVLLFVAGAACAVAALPGFAAASVPARSALQE